MVNEALTLGIGIGQSTMVAYILEFLIGVGVVYLAILGAVKTWDLLSASYRALKLDWDMARDREISLVRLWKERVSTARKHKVVRD